MIEELVKDEVGDVVHKFEGKPHNNMIGALTSMILKHWCGLKTEILKKNAMVLMNLKCNKMSRHEYFHRD